MGIESGKNMGIFSRRAKGTTKGERTIERER